MDIFDHILKIQNSMFKSVEKSFSKINKSISKDYKSPSCEISQNQKELSIKADLLGVEKNNIVLHITHDYLEILAEMKGQKTLLGKDYRGYRRIIPIPPGLVVDKTDAKFRSGKLMIRIPKTKTGKIKIK